MVSRFHHQQVATVLEEDLVIAPAFDVAGKDDPLAFRGDPKRKRGGQFAGFLPDMTVCNTFDPDSVGIGQHAVMIDAGGSDLHFRRHMFTGGQHVEGGLDDFRFGCADLDLHFRGLRVADDPFADHAEQVRQSAGVVDMGMGNEELADLPDVQPHQVRGAAAAFAGVEPVEGIVFFQRQGGMVFARHGLGPRKTSENMDLHNRYLLEIIMFR